MADTRVQLKVEDWVRDIWMLERFGQPFHRSRMKLLPGGYFDFDAVSTDKSIAACISTSSAKTAAGKYAVGKFMKLRSDMLFLLMAENLNRRFMVLTEESMFGACLKERESGRTPREIDFVLAEIPAELQRLLIQSRSVASREVSPKTLP